MYRVNPLPRKVLIVSDEVFAQSFIDATADPRIIVSAIQIAEERFVKPALGKELYYDFRDKKNTVVTAGNKAFLEAQFLEQDGDNPVILEIGEMVNALESVDNDWYVQLWNEHLWKYIAEAVVYIATPTNFSRFTASGETVNNPKVLSISGGEGTSGAQTVDLKDLKWKMDKMLQDRLDPLRAPMHEWLCENKVHFPLYKQKCACDETGVSVQRKTAWVHGLYDNNRERRCCDE